MKCFLILSLFVQADKCEWKNVCERKRVCPPQFEIRSPLEHIHDVDSPDDKEWHKHQQDKIINQYILKWAKTLMKGLGRAFFFQTKAAITLDPHSRTCHGNQWIDIRRFCVYDGFHTLIPYFCHFYNKKKIEKYCFLSKKTENGW